MNDQDHETRPRGLLMKHGLDWYKHEPRAFIDGVQGIGPETIGAYIVLLDLIYARGGETRRDDRHLAGILGCSIRKATSLTDKLIALEKLQLRDGFVTNSRALSDTKLARNDYEARSKSQSNRRETEAKSNKNNDLADKPSTSAFNRIEENRIEERTPSGVPKADSKPADPTPRQMLEAVLRPETADAVIKHRQRIGKAMTAYAAKLMAGKLAQCPDPDEAADTMIANGWQGFDPDWIKDRTARHASNPRQSTAGVLAEMSRNMEDKNDGPKLIQGESRRDLDATRRLR